MLKQFWRFRWIRIISGVILIIIGFLVGLLPGPGGFIFWLPGIIIIIEEFPCMRKLTAFAIRRFRKILRLRKFIKYSKKLVYQKTGWRLYFKKRKRVQK